MGVMVIGVPLVTAILPGVITPAPLLKTPVKVAEPPWVTLAAVAEVVKLVMEGSTAVLLVPTFTETELVTDTPLEFVTVSVYTVFAMGVTKTAVPLGAFKFPGEIRPVPFENTPVSETDCPADMVDAEVVKDEIDGAGGSAVVEMGLFELTEAPRELVTVRV
jgi:hypothetical protein